MATARLMKWNLQGFRIRTVFFVAFQRLVTFQCIFEKHDIHTHMWHVLFMCNFSNMSISCSAHYRYQAEDRAEHY